MGTTGNHARRAQGLLALSILLAVLAPHTAGLQLQGQFHTHDPSRITKCHGRYYVYCTGPNVQMRCSDDMIHWANGPSVLAPDRSTNGVPDWARKLVPGNTSNVIWAPDVLYFNGLYHLYYAFADWNTNDGVICLVTSPSLDPNAADYHWTDQGKIISSDATTRYSTIDPCPVFDRQGNLWLAFGGMSSGPRLIALDKNTGLRSASDTTIYQFAGNRGEASYIQYHDGYYYFFKNRGGCCKGVNSTYFIVMGRAKAITGPYSDKDGRDLMTTDGTLFLKGRGSKIGPGQIGIYSEGGVDYYSFHYYDGDNNGAPTLGIGTLTWGEDGWPIPE